MLGLVTKLVMGCENEDVNDNKLNGLSPHYQTGASDYPVPEKTTYAVPELPGSQGNQPSEEPKSAESPSPTPTQGGHLPHDISDTNTARVASPDSPPPSVFKNLKPSENRYSILRKDEL